MGGNKILFIEAQPAVFRCGFLASLCPSASTGLAPMIPAQYVTSFRVGPYGPQLMNPYPESRVHKPPIATEKVGFERKLFFLDLKENLSGRFLKIAGDVGGRRNAILRLVEFGSKRKSRIRWSVSVAAGALLFRRSIASWRCSFAAHDASQRTFAYLPASIIPVVVSSINNSSLVSVTK
jgi:hypothetical protein